MRIAYLAAGAAGMYCGSCLHDNTLAAELRRQGEDVILVPIYTPLRTDEEDVSLKKVFFGGINVYLQQRWKLFRRTPRWFDSWLDHPRILGRIGGQAAAVDPAQLGGLTVSMLQGEMGNQRKELEKLVDWLVDEVQPDIVHLSNSMMLGLARMISAKCGPPVVCSLSGEDIFLEKLVEPHYSLSRQLLKERAADVHAFVALNDYFATYMSDYLAVDRNRVHLIPHGLNLQGHAQRPQRAAGVVSRVGYLARICEEKGLHFLIEACEQLCTRGDLPDFELVAAGYLGAGDRAYFRQLQKKVAAGPLAGRFTYFGELSRAEKIHFLQSLDIFSTPTMYRESKGLPALEALANAVPVVLPSHGGFPELVRDTGGGLLFEPNNTADLAGKIAQLLREPAIASELGRRGRAAITARYHATAMAERTLSLYRSLVAKGV